MSAPVKQEIRRRVVNGNVWLSHDDAGHGFFARLPALLSRLHVFMQDALSPLRLDNGLSFVHDFERLLGDDFFRKVKSFTPGLWLRVHPNVRSLILPNVLEH
jgi:hypothetical protein